MPEPVVISGDEVKQKSPEDLFSQLASSPKGITSDEAAERLERYGQCQ